MEAFITHWRALRAAANDADEKEILGAMNQVLGTFDLADCAALESTDARTAGNETEATVHAHERRRERALSKLQSILAAAGWLQ
jgi:hypothetical protein